MRRTLALAACGLLFLALSALMARVLSANGSERSALIERLQQRAGGEVDVLKLDLSTRAAFTRQVGRARIAWRRPGGSTVVQCALVRRGGVLDGERARVLALERPIGLEASCPEP